ncbi:MAG: PH domain-containing protein [Alphaproteobacteria bacterium]|nr:PH domain-containing protein [Alphaproteobacteria bacterium]
MLYIQQILLPEEKIMSVLRLHWIIFLPGVLLTLFGGIFGFFSYEIMEALLGVEVGKVVGRLFAGLCMIIAILGLFLSSAAFVRQMSTELVITNKRIIAKYGFIARTTFEIMLNRITGVNFDQTVLGRMFDFGTILVYGAGGNVSPFNGIAHPEKFQRALMRVMGKISQDNRLF